MKANILKITAVLLMLAGSFSCQNKNQGLSEDLEVETDFFYTEQGEKESFNIRKDKVIVKCQSADDAKALSKKSMFLFAYNTGDWVIGTVDPKKNRLDDLLKIPEVVDATYGLEYRDGTLQYPYGTIYVKFKEGKSSEEVIADSGLSESVTSIELFNENYKGYIVTLTVPLGDILRICRNLYESGLYKCAVPIFKLEMKVGI